MTPARAPVLFIDCFSGISGDMMLAALLDLDPACATAIRACLGRLADLGLRLVEGETTRSGVRARTVRFDVANETDPEERSLAEIRSLLADRVAPAGALGRAMAAFEALAAAEGAVHGLPPERVHFHEVGALDSIGDFVGIAAGLEALGATVHAAPVPLGRGFVECRHGTLPLPAPATLALLRGVPVYGTDVEAELVTPTGAAVLRTQATAFGPLPPMRPRSVGWGAGARHHPGRPGLLRLVLGDRDPLDSAAGHAVLEANVDDMTPELAAHCVARALEEGALDAWVEPITMKKGRPALKLGVLARREDRDRLAALVLAESTSIGLRTWDVSRFELPRRVVTVDTPFGKVAVKIAGEPGGPGPGNVAPEFDSCREAARRAGVPLKTVAAAALAAALPLR